MANPYVDEVVAAVQCLDSQGLSRIVIVANCFGAWSSLVAAPKLGDVEAMALINCPVRRDHQEVRAGDESWQWWRSRLRNLRWSNLRSPHHRSRYWKLLKAKLSASVNPRPKADRLSSAISSVLASGTRLLMIYGPDGFRKDFDSALEASLSSQIDATNVLFVAQPVEGFPTLAAQDVIVQTVRSWLVQADQEPNSIPAGGHSTVPRNPSQAGQV
jgi:hypothetical protein